jgi:hypothetical protein
MIRVSESSYVEWESEVVMSSQDGGVDTPLEVLVHKGAILTVRLKRGEEVRQQPSDGLQLISGSGRRLEPSSKGNESVQFSGVAPGDWELWVVDSRTGKSIRRLIALQIASGEIRSISVE